MRQTLKIKTNYYLNGYSKVHIICNMSEQEVECIVIKPALSSSHKKGDIIWVRRNVLHRKKMTRVKA